MLTNIPLNKNNLSSGAATMQKQFISTWKTDNTGTSEDDEISLPLVSGGTYNFEVDWGDGNKDTITAYNQAEVTHTYSSAGTYTVKIKGQCEGFQFNNGGDKLKLLTIEKWGKDFRLGNFNSIFYGCSNLVINATDELETSEMTDFYRLFYGCTSLSNTRINFSDTSNVTNMTYAFRECTNFNGSIETWNTSNVTTMAGMFYSCLSFNKSVNFDTAKVTNMYAMFYNCPDFNQSVSSFDTSKVTNMSYMFSDCDDFNQELSHFDTSKVTDMRSMFYGSGTFNPNISGWNVGLVTDMSYMLYQKTSFNRDLSSWDISHVTTMDEMLTECTSWTQANYDAFLISADGQSVQSGVTFKCSSYYTSGGAAATARASLISGDSWNITDLGAA